MAAAMAATVVDKSPYELHKAVYQNDYKQVSKLLKQRESDVFMKDIHGNTPLHLAAMLGHKECISLLLAHNAPVKVKNAQGWNALAEAVSYGHRPTITVLLLAMKRQSKQSIHGKKPHVIDALKRMPDFYLELKWDFQSWIPFISSMLPSDVCKIYKKGASIRMDTTLVNFNDRTWERGDVSFIYKSEASPADKLMILDNKAKVYQRVRHEEYESEIDDEVDLLMSSDILNAQITTKTISFSRAHVGWFFKHPKTEQVGSYEAEYYNVDGLHLDTKKRREHLTAEDVKKNKAVLETLKTGKFGNEEDYKQLQNVVRRKSIAKPSKCEISWDDYISASAGNHPCLGRILVLKESVKQFKASVAMSTEFPLTIETLLDILEIVAPFKHLNKLRMFCQIKLPPGFPVRLEIPLLPTVSAKITFQKLTFRDDLQDNLFEVPNSYRQEQNRFPDI